MCPIKVVRTPRAADSRKKASFDAHFASFVVVISGYKLILRK